MELPKNDWRIIDASYTYVAEDTYLSFGQTAKKGAQITVVSRIRLNSKKELTIAVPNATALFLNASARSWKESKEIRKRNGIDSVIGREREFSSQSGVFDYLERVIESVIMAFSGLEAFVNEMIPDNYRYETHRRSEIILDIMDKEQIERHLSISEKLELVLPDALKTKSPKGRNFWGDFVKLRKIRDRIIHMKTADRESSGPDNPNLWHDLFRVSYPHRQALKMVDFFLSEMNYHPQWRQTCPLR